MRNAGSGKMNDHFPVTEVPFSIIIDSLYLFAIVHVLTSTCTRVASPFATIALFFSSFFFLFARGCYGQRRYVVLSVGGSEKGRGRQRNGQFLGDRGCLQEDVQLRRIRAAAQVIRQPQDPSAERGTRAQEREGGHGTQTSC